MAYPPGEAKLDALRVDFDRRLKLEFHGGDISSDAGLLPNRALDDALGLTELGGVVRSETRRGKNTRHLLAGLAWQSVFGRLAGYEDVNDAERLSQDPVLRTIVDRKGLERSAASTSQMGRFATEWLATEENLAASNELSGVWIDRVHERKPPGTIVLEMDSSESPTYREQQGSAHNGHFGCTCYHPLFVFNQFGDLERSLLRPGNVHSAENRRLVLGPVVERYRTRNIGHYFRGDAAFASPDIHEFLEAEGFLYAIRLPTNPILQRSVARLPTPPVGRPPNHVRRYSASFNYRAGSWDGKRRLVAKVEWHPGELVPRVGYIVTKLSRPAARVTRSYDGRGTAEPYLKEGKNAIIWTRLFRHGFRNNEVRLQLHALAYNPGLPAIACLARGRGTPVTDHFAGKAHQDRRQGRAPWSLHHSPDDGGRHLKISVRRDPAPD